MNEVEEKTFIVGVWSRVFKILSYLSIFQIIRIIFGQDKKDDSKPFVKSYLFVDIWVTAHLLLSFVSIYIIKYTDFEILNKIIVGYGLLRIFEVFVYQVNVLLFDEYRATLGNNDASKPQIEHDKAYYLRSYRRIIILFFGFHLHIYIYLNTLLQV